MKLTRTLGVPANPQTIQAFIEQTSKKLSGNVSFGSDMTNTSPDINIAASKATGTTPGVANTEFQVLHNQVWVPIGFIVISQDQQGAVFQKSTTAWTAAMPSAQGSIFLKCNVASVNYVLLII